MNKRVITVVLLILGLLIAGKLIWSGLKRLKVDEFHPAAVIFVMDSSASNQKRIPAEKKMLRQICNLLDPEDQIKILKVSEDSYLIYEGSPMNGSAINKAMNAFTKFEPKDYGTAYGLAMKKAFSHALNMKKLGYVPAIVVIGDLENEGAVEKQINWDTLDAQTANVKQQAPDVSMMFLDAHPQKLDLVKEKLTPVLGEEHLIVSPEQNFDKSIRRFLKAIGR
ncbi:MAG: VWA domain-containing protein [Heliobacteriaceae bacterium]|nr:VWA domain-containing protein [Heliobacteriaceae bacterium]